MFTFVCLVNLKWVEGRKKVYDFFVNLRAVYHRVNCGALVYKLVLCGESSLVCKYSGNDRKDIFRRWNICNICYTDRGARDASWVRYCLPCIRVICMNVWWRSKCEWTNCSRAEGTGFYTLYKLQWRTETEWTKHVCVGVQTRDEICAALFLLLYMYFFLISL